MDNQPDKNVKNEVIQGGLGFIDSLPKLNPIVHETTLMTGLRHFDGTLSMARDGPGTASSEFLFVSTTSRSWITGVKEIPTARVSPPSAGWSWEWKS